MNPIQSITRAVRNYFKFHGRASRPEFWWFFIGVVILEGIFIVWQQAKFPLLILGSLTAWLKFLTLLPLVHLVLLPAATLRRLHDTGRSARWLFILVGTICGWVVFVYGLGMASLEDMDFALFFVILAVLVFLPIVGEMAMLFVLFRTGTKGDNRYGPDPLAVPNRGRGELSDPP